MGFSIHHDAGYEKAIEIARKKGLKVPMLINRGDMMKILTEYVEISTRGHADMVDITPDISSLIRNNGFENGNLTVFVSGSTAGVTTIEYEPGLKKDFPEMLDKVAPAGVRYHHDDTWGDRNGHAHLRAALIGPSLTVPFRDGKMLLGTWQQVVVVDFDARPRQRKIVVQIMGE